MKAFWASVVGGLICAGVGLREWFYLHEHVHHGPAGELVALSIAGALVSFSVAAIANRLEVQARQNASTSRGIPLGRAEDD